MPRPDPRPFVQQQALAVRATVEDEEHDDIHMLGDIAVAQGLGPGGRGDGLVNLRRRFLHQGLPGVAPTIGGVLAEMLALKGEEACRHPSDRHPGGGDARGPTAGRHGLDHDAVRVGRRMHVQVQFRLYRTEVQQIVPQLHQFRLEIPQEQLAPLAPERSEPYLTHPHTRRRGDEHKGKGPFHPLDTRDIHVCSMAEGFHDGEGAPNTSQGVQQHRHTREAVLIGRACAPEEMCELHQAPRRDVHQACAHADVHPEHGGWPTRTDVVEDRLHVRQGERFDDQPEEHEDGGQETRPADRQVMAEGPGLGREHIQQQEATEAHHKGQVDQEETRADDADDAVHAMQVGDREERVGHQGRHGGAIRRHRGRIGDTTANQPDGQTCQEREGEQEAFAEQVVCAIHDQYSALCRNCPNAEGATSSSPAGRGASLSTNEYCIAPTAKASALASSSSATI